MTPEYWLTRIFEQAPVAIALLEGADYRIKLANATMYEIWQLPTGHASVIGQPVFEAFPSIAGIGLETLLNQVRQTQQPIKGIEAPYASQGNQTAYVNFVYAPIYDEQGDINVVVIATEVTQQVLDRQRIKEGEERYRQQAQELATSNEALGASNEELAASNEELAASNEEYAAINEELEEANSLLTRSNDNLQTFAYIASHDLQEPLRKIQQFGNLLQTRFSDSISAEAISYLERMQGAAGRMSTLIRDLLSFSQISTQRVIDVPVNLSDVVSQVLIVLDLAVSEIGAQVQVSSLPTVLGDAAQLGQLFQNLLTNALKFRRIDLPSVITISSQLVPAVELSSEVKPTRRSITYYRIEVADNGIGFEEKYLDRIFGVFQRLHSKDKYTGTGVGLAICEKVVTNHGGFITAQSRPGQGATFIIYLPAEQ